MSKILQSELKELCSNVLKKAGMRSQDIDITIDHLIENELSGKASHGLVRVVETYHACRKYGVPKRNPEIEWDQDNIIRINANRQIGVVAIHYGMTIAIERAQKHGIAFTGIRDYIATSGSMAYPLRRIAEKGLVAIMGCNSVALVSPPAGKERLIGTNPIGIGIPGENNDHFIADLATSAIAYGKIMVLNDKGEDIPEGVLIDKDGNSSINPKDAYEGAILPLADYKGFALGLMVELLAGPLIGAKACKKELYDSDGYFMITLDPSHFGNGSFASQISHILEAIKNMPPRPGYEEVSIPGDRSNKQLMKHQNQDMIEVVDNTLQSLEDLLLKE